MRLTGEARRRVLVALAGLVIAAVVVPVAIVLGRSSGGDAGAATSTAPDAWRLPTLDGRGAVGLLDLRGTPVVVDFFASWCAACDGELPGFARTAAAVGDRVRFVGVDSLETGDPAPMIARDGIGAFMLLRDLGGAAGSGLHDALGGRGMPVTAFYDGSGRLQRVEQGAVTEARLRALLTELDGVT